jgi:carbon storage regulator
MLVLSRQRDETIMIGDDIEVTVVDIRGDKVRLGINAPKEVAVHRKEVYDQIKKENREAAQIKPADLVGLKMPPKVELHRPNSGKTDAGKTDGGKGPGQPPEPPAGPPADPKM